MPRASDNAPVAVTRCPRCRAEDIAADAHPTRVLSNGVETRVFVCRNCYRPTELEYRIACDAAAVTYRPLPIREALRGLHDFYRARLDERDEPEIHAALADVARRLAIGPVDDT
jgi:hypothetical protein